MAKTSRPSGQHHQGYASLSARHAAAIGYVAIYWSEVELQIVQILGSLVDAHTPVVGLAVSLEMTFFQRLAAVRTLLVETRDQDLVEAWDTTTTWLNMLRGKRNDIIHANWMQLGTHLLHMRKKAKGRIKLVFGRVELAQIQALSEDILQAYDHLQDFGILLTERGAFHSIRASQSSPPPSPGLSRKAQLLEEARDIKRAMREADRVRSRSASRIDSDKKS